MACDLPPPYAPESKSSLLRSMIAAELEYCLRRLDRLVEDAAQIRGSLRTVQKRLAELP